MTTAKFRGKGLQAGKVGSARLPRACLPAGKSCPGHNRGGSYPGQQLSCRDEDLVFLCVQKTGAWHGKWHSFPSPFTEIIDDAMSETVQVTEV